MTYANFWAQSLDSESPVDDTSYCYFLSASSFHFFPASYFRSYSPSYSGIFHLIFDHLASDGIAQLSA